MALPGKRFYQRLLSLAATSHRNGRQNDKQRPPAVGTNGCQPGARLHPQKTRGIRPGSKPPWRQRPLLTLNKCLLGLAVVFTIAVPALVHVDARALRANLAEPPQVHRSGKAAMKRIQVSGGSFAQIAAKRPYFRPSGSEAKTGGSQQPIDAVDVPGLAQRYALVGVIMGESPRAIVRARDNDSSQFLAKGDHLEGYLVQEIFSDRILLEQDGDLINLRM